MVVRRYKISRLRSLVSYRVECSKRNSVSTRVHAIFSILSLGRDEAGSENFFGGGGVGASHGFQGDQMKYQYSVTVFKGKNKGN